jgi:hypothetical protein
MLDLQSGDAERSVRYLTTILQAGMRWYLDGDRV